MPQWDDLKISTNANWLNGRFHGTLRQYNNAKSEQIDKQYSIEAEEKSGRIRWNAGKCCTFRIIYVISFGALFRFWWHWFQVILLHLKGNEKSRMKWRRCQRFLALHFNVVSFFSVRIGFYWIHNIYCIIWCLDVLATFGKSIFIASCAVKSIIGLLSYANNASANI